VARRWQMQLIVIAAVAIQLLLLLLLVGWQSTITKLVVGISATPSSSSSGSVGKSGHFKFCPKVAVLEHITYAFNYYSNILSFSWKINSNYCVGSKE
jgi:hypothetical protein